MIAKRRRVIAKLVHGCDDRMKPIAHRLCKEVGQRIALEEVAIVDQKAVAHLAPQLPDQSRCTIEPEAWQRHF